jgi:hypothetical protein
MKIIKKTFILILLVAQFSCAYKNNIKQHFDGNIKSVETVSYNKIPKADYFTFSEALGAALIIGAIPMSFFEIGVVDLKNLEDPANFLKKSVAEVISKKYHTKSIINKETKENNGNNSQNLLQKYQKGDWVLNIISTINGGYYPFRVTKFRTNYSAMLTILDRKSESVILRSNCLYNEKENNKFSLKQISENNKILEKFLNSAKQYCLKKFTKEIAKN